MDDGARDFRSRCLVFPTRCCATFDASCIRVVAVDAVLTRALTVGLASPRCRDVCAAAVGWRRDVAYQHHNVDCHPLFAADNAVADMATLRDIVIFVVCCWVTFRRSPIFLPLYSLLFYISVSILLLVRRGEDGEMRWR